MCLHGPEQTTGPIGNIYRRILPIHEVPVSYVTYTKLTIIIREYIQKVTTTCTEKKVQTSRKRDHRRVNSVLLIIEIHNKKHRYR